MPRLEWTATGQKTMRLAAGAASSAFAAPSEKPDFLPGYAPCHGIDGISRDAEAPPLPRPNEAYLLIQLRAFHSGRRAQKEMLYMSRKMTEEDMRALAAYYASLPSR